MSEKFEYYKARMKRAAEEALSAGEKQTREELWDKALRGGSKYERVVSALLLVKEFLPEKIGSMDKQRIKDLFYYKDQLPFNPDHYSFEDKLGAGAESNVYLLESKTDSPSLALKIAMPSRRGRALQDQAKEFMDEYRAVAEIYKDMPGLVPKEQVLILHDPFLKNRSAVAVLQPFAAGEVRDLFDMSPAEIEDLRKRDRNVGGQIQQFANITLDYFNKTGKTADIIGPTNIAVVTSGQGSRMVFLDPRMTHSLEHNPQGQKILTQKLEFLARLTAEDEREETSAA